MAKSFELTKFKSGAAAKDQYQRQLRRLTEGGKAVDCVERAVREALANLSGTTGRKAFVIYGEPQSGKTEMMICLTAKLLDVGRPLIIHLLNDSVDLLGQNLGRFKASGLAPSAQNFSEILDPSISLTKGQFVIFCKKNAKDLQKLFNKVGAYKGVVIIDDEADYASPNGKVNKAEKTKINKLISDLLGKSGDYVGVTATPARLDLNNTFDNDSSLWVNFPPHDHYTGPKIFFPFDEIEAKENQQKFRLTLLPDKVDDPKFARAALFSFLVNVGYLNLFNNTSEINYSMLIHTSGKKVDHKTDWGTMQEALSSLVDRSSKKFDKYVHDIWNIAHDRYLDADPDNITSYVIDNIMRNAVIILNSDSDFRQNGDSATNPSSLFTIVIGGNIVSRGVTFDNLLSMFFTRDVKHKIQQDTYIQRARMFGARGKYLDFFELTIPEALYGDWHRCFVFHRLSLASITSGKGSPVWLSDSRIAAVASASIDKSTVDIDRGEMAFALFKFADEMDAIAGGGQPMAVKLEKLSSLVGDDGFPEYLRRFITRMSEKLDDEVTIQKSGFVYPSMTQEEKASISRGRGMMGSSQTNSGNSKHALKLFRNDEGFSRLYYKFSGSIEFMKNMK
jgi:hypothetical protein